MSIRPLLFSLLFLPLSLCWSQEEGVEEIIIPPRSSARESVALKAAASPRPSKDKTEATVPPAAPSAAQTAPSTATATATTPTANASPNAPAEVTEATPAQGRPIPFKNVIHTVDREEKLITIGKRKFHILRIRPETRIQSIDGTPGTIEDLEPGQEVRGSYRKLDKLDWEAISIKYGSKPKAEE